MISPLPVVPLKPGSATRPLFGIEVDVVNEQGQPVPAGEEGYLVVKKPWPGMLRTIFKDPERYQSLYWGKFGDMYLAGDSARKDKDGYIWVIGRIAITATSRKSCSPRLRLPRSLPRRS